MVDVAALITDLISAGTDPVLVGRVAAALAEREAVIVEKRDEQAERRREMDRERKARVRGIPQTSADSADNPPPEEKRKVSPCTPSKEKTQTPSHHLASLGDENISATSKKRSTRLPADWTPDEAGADYARGLGLTSAEIAIETEKIRDWSASSPNGVKKDWSAAWRNWVRSASERKAQNESRRPERSVARPASNNPRLAQALGSLWGRGGVTDPFATTVDGDEVDADEGDRLDRARAVFSAHVERNRRGSRDDGVFDGLYEVR